MSDKLMISASPRPWFINGHSIEANDKSLLLQNEKTGRGVVAILPSAPEYWFKKDERAKMDALTAANAKLIVDAVNGEVGVSKTETTTGDNAKLREAIERIRTEAYECDQGGEYLGEGSDPGFDRIVKLCDAALAALGEKGGNDGE